MFGLNRLDCLFTGLLSWSKFKDQDSVFEFFFRTETDGLGLIRSQSGPVSGLSRSFGLDLESLEVTNYQQAIIKCHHISFNYQ